MSLKSSTLPDSYLKNVAVRLPKNFSLVNSPFPADIQNTQPFIGNEENSDKLIRFLASGKGVFLVTGYRGMGKTSFVNKVINGYKTPPNSIPDRVLDIRLTLAQNNPREIDILRLMTSSALDRYTKKFGLKKQEDRRKKFNETFTSLLFVILLLLVLPVASIIWGEKIVSYFGSEWCNWLRQVSYCFLGTGLVYLLFYSLRHVVLTYLPYYRPGFNYYAYGRLKALNERCYAALTHENDQNEATNVFARLLANINPTAEKKVRKFPIAGAKEIEYELNEILDSLKADVDFIFIFDELDKIDLSINTAALNDDLEIAENQKAENAYQVDIRNRKQAVINVIAGLKNFLTTAPANFIFIAGREMFDASLADIADRQSSVSSIFTYIFNIESLLKTNHVEKDPSANGNGVKNNASQSYFIEEYLCRIMFQPNNGQGLYQQLLDLKVIGLDGHTEKKLKKEEQGKIYFTFQNFITYLTYRSNGSPKKMIRAIQEFIVVRKLTDFEKDCVFVQGNTISHEQTAKDDIYLFFNYYNQYKIGFLSYLYRPFLIQYGRSYKLYSDSINVSTPYLVDHLLKFHPFAFSLSNLELMPEVLSATKTPALKEHIKQIIDHLAANHIRETEISLFDYKFYSRTTNEIVFLSKISEPEAAAFNFTLDESNLIKLHMRNKIRELRKIYERFAGDGQQIYSIARFNSILGDLLFFDQEYDDAIIAYADAIRSINQLDMGSMNMRDFFMLIKNKLKQGLCFEKMSAYEEALSFYTDSNQDAKNFIAHRVQCGRQFNLNKDAKKSDSDEPFYNSSLNDALEIVVQTMLAKVVLQEKMGFEGISGAKLFIDLGGFITMVNGLEKISGRSVLIAANAYLLTGKLLYFKNSTIGFENFELFKGALPPDLYLSIKELLKNNTKFMVGHRNFRTPVLALYLYLLGLKEVLKGKTDDLDITGKLPGSFRVALDKLSPLAAKPVPFNFSGFHYSQIGTFLSNIGDALLSMYVPLPRKLAAGKKTLRSRVKDFRVNELFNLHEFSKNDPTKNDFDCVLRKHTGTDLDITDILRAYFLAGQFFLNYGRIHACSFQYRKILWVIRLVINAEDTSYDDREKGSELIKQLLVVPVLKMIGSNAEHTDVHMFHKAADYLYDKSPSGMRKSQPAEDALIMNNMSNSPETREIILLFNYIRIKLNLEVMAKKLVTPYNSFASQYSRMLELDFYGKFCYKKQQEAIESPVPVQWDKERVEDAVNYIFSMLSIIRILKIYGTDFIAGHSFYAYTHFRVADFLTKISSHAFNTDEGPVQLTNYLKARLDSFFDEKSFTAVDASYHYQMAQELYNRTIQLHTAGKEYEKMIGAMLYLEDDFNDNAFHFGAAFERFMMINRNFEGRINQCKDAIDKDRRYKPEIYTGESV